MADLLNSYRNMALTRSDFVRRNRHRSEFEQAENKDNEEVHYVPHNCHV